MSTYFEAGASRGIGFAIVKEVRSFCFVFFLFFLFFSFLNKNYYQVLALNRKNKVIAGVRTETAALDA